MWWNPGGGDGSCEYGVEVGTFLLIRYAERRFDDTCLEILIIYHLVFVGAFPSQQTRQVLEVLYLRITLLFFPGLIFFVVFVLERSLAAVALAWRSGGGGGYDRRISRRTRERNLHETCVLRTRFHVWSI